MKKLIILLSLHFFISYCITAQPAASNKIEIDIKTGNDNLEPKSTQHNAEVRVILQGRGDVIKTNINEGKEWPNNSTHRITLALPADITIDDVKEVHIYRKRDGLQYVWQLGEKDNWNVDRVTVNASIVTDGKNVRTKILETGATRPRVPGANNLTRPLYRFIYEGGDNVTEGQFFKLKLAAETPNTPATTTNPEANASILAIFGTGGDDLRGGGDNVNIVIRFKSSKPAITISHANSNSKWDNFSEKSFRKVLPNTANLDFNDIKEVELRHTGGGGMGADNWYLDKFKLIITKDSETKTLVDKVMAPIHYFTGDTRRKTFKVE